MTRLFDQLVAWLIRWTERKKPTVTFSTSGLHTMRVQVREDGVQLDQIVLSPSRYLHSAPGPATRDSAIVPKVP